MTFILETLVSVFLIVVGMAIYDYFRTYKRVITPINEELFKQEEKIEKVASKLLLRITALERKVDSFFGSNEIDNGR